MTSTEQGAQVYTQVFDATRAAEWLESFRYPYQRKLRLTNVAFLAAEMANGTFDQSTVIRIAICGGDFYLIDGQHRLSAVVRCKLEQRFYVMEESFESMDDVARAYGTIDRNGIRSDADAARAAQLSERMGLVGKRASAIRQGATFLIRCANGTSNAQRNERLPYHEVDRVAMLYAPYLRAFYDAVLPKVPDGTDTGFYRATSHALLMLTLRWPRAESSRTTNMFWSGAMYDDGLAATDARKAANRILTSFRIIAPNVTRANAVTSLQNIRALAYTYNAYLENRSLKYPKVTSGPIPKINGVPEDMTQWIK
jgi:hypothetical protein